MSRYLLYSCVILAMTSLCAQAQVGDPGIHFSTQIAAGDGGQLYPYDRQDPWLHGHFQRVPAYGGFASFRPYNYRHVFAQTQIAGQWGLPHGMPYSQQFWNKYRGSYLDGNLHSQVAPSAGPMAAGNFQPVSAAQIRQQSLPSAAPIFQTSYDSEVRPFVQPTMPQQTQIPAQESSRPIHIFPAGTANR